MIKKFFCKTSFRFFFSLLVAVLVIFGLNFIVFKNSANMIYDQVKKHDRVIMKSIVESYDQCFKEANDTINTISMINLQIYDYEQYKNLNMSNVVLLYNEVKLLISKDYIFDFAVYFKNSDLAITSQGTVSFTDLFNQKFKNMSHAPEFWKNFSNTKHDMQIIPSAYYTEKTSDGNVYDRKLIGIVGSNKLNHSDINVIMFLDENKIAEYTNWDNAALQLSVTVLDQDRNVVLNSGQRDITAVVNQVFFPKGTTEITLQQDGDEYYCVKSSYNDFTYITKITYEYEKAGSVIENNRFVMLAELFLGLILSALLSMYLNRPVRKLSRLVTDKDDGLFGNDFGDIYSSVEKIQDENDLYKKQLNTLEQDIRRSVFLRMVDDVVNDNSIRDQMRIHFKSVFCYERFAMLSLLFERKSTAMQQGNTDRRDMITPDMLGRRIEMSIRKFFDSSEVIYIENMTFVVLLGFNKGVIRSDVMSKVRTVMKELNKVTASQFWMTGALSKFYMDTTQCKNAFRDIKMSIAYKSLKSDCDVIDCDNIHIASDIYFPSDYIERLSYCILNGNRETSKAIIHDVIDKNIQDNISCVKFSNIVCNIFYNIINTLHFCRYDKNELVKMEWEFFEIADNMKNYADIRKFFDKIIDRTIASINMGKQGKLTKEFVVAYINLHYEEELCLESMAEITETSSKYFSNFFKKAVGVNFVEYLNKVRMQHAKELLRMTKFTVSDVGTKVGFSNLSTFTSTFKKYTGGTPSEYRKSVAVKDNEKV